jgi:putative ABC transport system substrate-binding protein
MQRREFITFLGGAAAAWPLAAGAQQRPTVPVIGFLQNGVPDLNQNFGVTAFRKGLSETGYVEGRNVASEYRWAHYDNARLPNLAAELVSRRVALIAAMGSTAAALAAKAATATIPIVFTSGLDPVESGLVISLNRPGSNVTGVTTMSVDLGAKRFGLLIELLPRAKRIALLVNPDSTTTESVIADLRSAATATGHQIDVFSARSNREIDAAFANLAQKPDAVMVAPDTLFSDRRVQLATLAAHHHVPAIYPFRRNAEAGGLMSYGTTDGESQRLAGIYAGRILKGENPADLPIQRATKFELVINLQTARTLGIEIPVTLIARADEVIE